MALRLLGKIDTSKIDPLIVDRVCTMTGATAEHVTEGWCMDEWAGNNVMLEMMELHTSRFVALNSSDNTNEVLVIRNKFKNELTQEEIDSVWDYLLVDRFCLRKLYALVAKKTSTS